MQGPPGAPGQRRIGIGALSRKGRDLFEGPFLEGRVRVAHLPRAHSSEGPISEGPIKEYSIVARSDDQLEVVRAELEELQGKIQQALGRIQGKRGAARMIRGRGLELRGKARGTIARARLGVDDFTSSVREHPETFAPFAGLFAVGATIAFLAIFSPRTLSRVWDWLRGTAMETRSTLEEQARSMRSTTPTS